MSVASKQQALAILIVALLPASTIAKPVPLPGAKASWIRGHTAHFTVMGDAGERSVTRVARQLESFRAAIGKIATGIELNSPLPTYVYVFRDERSFDPYNGLPAGSTGTRSAYFTSGEDANFVALNVAAEHGSEGLVFHEYLHYVLRNNFPGVPTWLNEGFAEFYSSFRRLETAAEVGLPIEASVRLLRTTPLMPLADLFAITTNSPQYNEANTQTIFYAQAWALTHYLLMGPPELRGKSGELLGRLEKGQSSAEAIQATYGTTLAALETALRKYVRQTRFQFATVELGQAASSDEIEFEPMPRAELLVALGNLLAHDDDTLTAAEEHFRSATQLTPALAPAWAGLGQIASRRGKLDDAARLYSKALELAPDNPRTLEMAATNLLRKVTGAEGQKFEIPKDPPPEVRKARDYLSRSLAIDPSQAEAYAAFGMTFLFERANPRPGIPALERAHRMLPSRPDIAFNLVQLYLAAEDRAGAEELLAGPWTRIADPAAVAAARGALLNFDLDRSNDQLEAGDYPGAIATLREARLRAHDPALMARIDEQIGRLEAAATGRRQADEINRAVAAANDGDISGAIAIVESLLPTLSDPALAESARNMLDSLRAHERKAARAPKGVPKK